MGNTAINPTSYSSVYNDGNSLLPGFAVTIINGVLTKMPLTQQVSDPGDVQLLGVSIGDGQYFAQYGSRVMVRLADAQARLTTSRGAPLGVFIGTTLTPLIDTGAFCQTANLTDDPPTNGVTFQCACLLDQDWTTADVAYYIASGKNTAWAIWVPGSTVVLPQVLVP